MALTREFDFLIQWHLTERCNLRCTHCYQAGSRRAELRLAEIEAVIDEIAHMLGEWEKTYGLTFAPSFNITGGEPFLRPDLFTILADIIGRGFAVFVLSNGTLIDAATADGLARLGVGGVQVSIEGPAELHDGIRGPGSFEAALAGTRNLVAAGIAVTWNVTISQLNAPKVEEIAPLAAAIGVRRLGFSRLVPAGRGEELRNAMLAPSEVGEVYRQLFSLEVPGLEIVTGDPVAAQMDPLPQGGEPAQEIPCGGCAAGVSGLTILADGTVVPCRRLEIPIGNVRTDSLREIWATSEVLNRLREKRNYGGKCGVCRRWADCRGCRGVAYGYSRAEGKADYLATDPQCFLP
jgi:MoaA/NifB/PqqE/SkfB family radical SAM enzyme